MGDAVYYYFKDIYDALRIAQVGVRLIFLDHDYSEFRPVVPDEECFYRSFIFSYLTHFGKTAFLLLLENWIDELNVFSGPLNFPGDAKRCTPLLHNSGMTSQC
jgi:hypothetical protein